MWESLLGRMRGLGQATGDAGWRDPVDRCGRGFVLTEELGGGYARVGRQGLQPLEDRVHVLHERRRNVAERGAGKTGETGRLALDARDERDPVRADLGRSVVSRLRGLLEHVGG